MNASQIYRRVTGGAERLGHIVFGCRYVGRLPSGQVLTASNRAALRRLANASVVLRIEGPPFFETVRIEHQPEGHGWQEVRHNVSLSETWTLTDRQQRCLSFISIEALVDAIYYGANVADLELDPPSC